MNSTEFSSQHEGAEKLNKRIKERESNNYVNGYWDSMSAEVLNHIFYYLTFEELNTVSIVCKYWREVVNMVSNRNWSELDPNLVVVDKY